MFLSTYTPRPKTISTLFAAFCGELCEVYLQNANHSVHLADFTHGLHQILLDAHSQIPPKMSVLSFGRRMVPSPFVKKKVFAVLLVADDSSHLAQFLHRLHQVLLEIHNQIPPKLYFL